MYANLNEVFGRVNQFNTVDILFINDGERATRLDVDGLYPVDSLLSTRYEHAEGIILTLEQCEKIGIEIEYCQQ